MLNAVFYQVVATASAAVVSGYFAGGDGAFSAAIGGIACFLPNLLFAWRLRNNVGRTISFTHFFIGEFIKVAATIGLLLITVKVYSNLNWPCFLAGMAVALQAGFLAFWKKS